MPKKTAYSRSGAQRNKTKQKSFEVVRPASTDSVLETIESSEEEDKIEEDVVDETSVEQEKEEEEVVEEAKSVKAKAEKSTGATTAAVISEAPAKGAPKSAAARLAARRQATQKTQRSSDGLVTVEHYNYVRKDLIFILILAVIMFGVIVALHFVLGS